MPYLAYDPASGEIVGAVQDSPEWAGNKAAMGFTVLETPMMAEIAGSYVADGAVTPKTGVALAPDKSQILADGLDQAVVSVTVEGPQPPASIELLVGGQSEVVALSSGGGSLSPVSALTPCRVVVQLADGITFRAEPVIIEAVSHE
ncbi:MAG: hypothetical protein K9K66_14175 [Desulfarculaceae bacterium]|nr:hypothetical protein [Desulfarculaceae bacterium]MCF8073819.1 hypothetical protein [Desulfarculaceae bacterium]MCF8102799.1 hypothetical protein [Desulfarculaceae bacterium]MCF8116243.1 hypothetical protein [Desulfarculaceae bacterium]